MIAIIIEFRLIFTTEIYNIFQNLYIVVNIYISKNGYTTTIKYFKKN